MKLFLNFLYKVCQGHNKFTEVTKKFTEVVKKFTEVVKKFIEVVKKFIEVTKKFAEIIFSDNLLVSNMVGLES